VILSNCPATALVSSVNIKNSFPPFLFVTLAGDSRSRPTLHLLGLFFNGSSDLGCLLPLSSELTPLLPRGGAFSSYSFTWRFFLLPVLPFPQAGPIPTSPPNCFFDPADFQEVSARIFPRTFIWFAIVNSSLDPSLFPTGSPSSRSTPSGAFFPDPLRPSSGLSFCPSNSPKCFWTDLFQPC